MVAFPMFRREAPFQCEIEVSLEDIGCSEDARNAIEKPACQFYSVTKRSRSRAASYTVPISADSSSASERGDRPWERAEAARDALTASRGRLCRAGALDEGPTGRSDIVTHLTDTKPVGRNLTLKCVIVKLGRRSARLHPRPGALGRQRPPEGPERDGRPAI
jgi:hypothetical protein